MPTVVNTFDGRTVKFYARGEPLDFVVGPTPFRCRDYDCDDVNLAKKIFATEAMDCNVVYDVVIRQMQSFWAQPKVTISGFRARV